MSITAEQAAALRRPFPAESVGKLPKSTCRDCSQSQRKKCDRHSWISNCPECRGSHTSATLHLDYVGHAATTDRLLTVDPEWTWEPFAFAPDGLPALDRAGNLWIRLTICGVTRIGVGDGKSAKECIGDAIRNAAMRFGVALDLWSKEDLAGEHPDTPAPVGDQPAAAQRVETPQGSVDPSTGEIVQPSQARPAPESPLLNTSSGLAKRMFALLGELGLGGDGQKAERLAYVTGVCGRPIGSSTEMTDADAERVIAAIERDLQNPFQPPEEGS